MSPIVWLCLLASLSGQTERYPAAKHGGNYMHNFYLPPAPSATAWAPAWSPDGKKIAVSLQGSIWQVDPETGKALELTYNRRYHSSPAWSPDGRWIVYTADENQERIQLEILNVETGESRPLTDDHHLYLDPAFSPRGNRLAYVSTLPNGYFNVYTRPIREGRWEGEPVPLTQDHRYPRNRLYFGAWDMHLQPTWTPSGDQIVFLSNRGVPLGSGDLWRMPARSMGINEAEQILQEQTLYRTRPHVSPDGKRIIYSSTGGAVDQFSHLYVVPLEGGSPYKMTFGDHDDFHPRWSPDGERIAYISNQGGHPHLVVMETYSGRKQRVSLDKRDWKRPMATVQIRVEQKGRPVPARVMLTAADGKFYAPEDSYARTGLYGQHFFHTSGESTVRVPAGPLRLTASRGFEIWPDQAGLDIEAGTEARVTLQLKRMTSAEQQGWYSGSTHVHMNYGGNLRNSPQNLIRMSRAEDQDVINELIANKDNRILDWQYFEPGGGEHTTSKPHSDMVLIVGEEYRPPFYGHVFLLGLEEHLISPFTTGYEGTGIESLYPSNTDVLRKASQQGAVTGYVHPVPSEEDPVATDLGVGKAFPVDAALGTVDAYEWSRSSRMQLKIWHHALNNDLRITPTGGEDSISDLHISKVVGSLRTYAHLGETLSAEAWLESLRQGRTYFSSGPILDFEIEDRLPGQELHLPPQGGRLRMRGRVWSIVPLDRIVVHRNGEIYREIPIREDAWERPANQQAGLCAEFDQWMDIDQSSWFSLYAEGPASPLLDVDYPQAATNAIRVYVGDQKIRNAESARYFIGWIEKLTEMARDWPWWRSDREIESVLAQFASARRRFQELAGEDQGTRDPSNRGAALDSHRNPE